MSQVTLSLIKNFRTIGAGTNATDINALGTDYTLVGANNWYLDKPGGAGTGRARNSYTTGNVTTPGRTGANNQQTIPAILTGAAASADIWTFARVPVIGGTLAFSPGLECRAVTKTAGGWWKAWMFFHSDSQIYFDDDETNFGPVINGVSSGISLAGRDGIVLASHSVPISGAQVQYSLYIFDDPASAPFDDANPGSFTPLWSGSSTRTYTSDRVRLATQPCYGGLMNFGDMVYTASGFAYHSVGYTTPTPLAPGTVHQVDITSIGAVAKAAAASGGVGVATYQWQKWTGSAWANLTNGTGGASNATTNTLCLTSQTPGSVLQVRCAYTDATPTTVYSDPITLTFLASDYKIALALGNSRTDKRWATSDGSTDWNLRAPSVAASILRGQGKRWKVFNGANAGRRLSDYATDQDAIMSTALGVDIASIEDYGGGAIYGTNVVLVLELINELRDADWATLNAGLGAAANYTTQLGQVLTRLQAGLPFLQKVIFFKPDAVKATAAGWNASAQARQDILWNATLDFVAANSSLCAVGTTAWYEYSKTHDVGTNTDVHGPTIGFHDLWGTYLAADINLIYDSVPPTLVSAATSVGGTQINYLFSEPMANNTSGLVSKVNGSAVGVLYSSRSTDLLTLTQTLDRGITGADSVTTDYAPGTITDTAGNPLAGFTGHLVSNNSTVSGGGGGGGVSLLVMGPFELSLKPGCGCELIALTRTDVVPLRLHLTGLAGQRVPVSAEILSASLERPGEVLVSNLPLSVIAGDEGFINVTVDTNDSDLTTTTSCDLVVSRSVGGQVLIFKSPVRIS